MRPTLRNVILDGQSVLTRNCVAAFDAYTGITSASSRISQWDDQTGLGHHLLQGTAGNKPVSVLAGVNDSGTAAAGAATTITLAVSALAFDNLYTGMTVAITGGTGAGQSRTITGYVGSTKVATVAAWSVTPDNTSTYSVSSAYPGVYCDGVGHFLKATAFTLNQPETVYLVCKQVGWTNTGTFVDGNALNGMRLLQSGGSPGVQMYAGGGASTPTETNLAVGQLGVMCGVFNGATSLYQLNSNAESAHIASGTNNAAGLTLGAAGSNALFGNIQVNEARIYSVAHDAATRAKIIGYLRSKWGA